LNHARKRSSGEDGKSRCDLPNDIIKNIVSKQKGVFYAKKDDEDEEVVRQIYNRTVILQKYDGADRVVVISLWRAGNPRAHHGRRDEFERVDSSR
jgi:hypothetical protein